MDVYQRIKKLLLDLNLEVVKEDTTKPWGGFFVINEARALEFINVFFPCESFKILKISEKVSTKILMVAPGKRLSWQYHHRRAEIWRCIDGQVAVVTSKTDIESERQILKFNDIIQLQQRERHRLIGLDQWGVITEIWQHTNSDYPSDEDDIIRIQDDYGR